MARKGNRRIYKVTDKIHKTNSTLFGKNWKCRFCGEKFKEGDTIYALYNNNVKWYHRQCYNLTLYNA
jgi:hypothetical protein